MSFWSDIALATGSGIVDYRLMVEGWPHEWVTNPRITHTTNGQDRIVFPGLQYTGLKLSERIILPDAWPQVTSMTVTISPTDTNEDTLNSFTRDVRPASTLTASLAYADTTWTTFPLDLGPGVYHLGTEAVLCDGDNNITRGYWDTGIQLHSTTIANTNNTVPIYNWPPTMEGRRAYLFVYGTADDGADDGTCIWRGVVARPPKMAKDGVTWTIEMQPITSVFDQNVGGNDQVEYRIRGVYHSRQAPMFISIGVGNSDFGEGIGFAYLSGFFETQNDWVAYVNTQLAILVGTPSTNVQQVIYSGTADDGAPFLTILLADEDEDVFVTCLIKDVIDGDMPYNSQGNARAITDNLHNTIQQGDSSGQFVVQGTTNQPPWSYPLPSARTMVGLLWFDALGSNGPFGYKPYTDIAVLDNGYPFDGGDPAGDWPGNRVYMQSVEGLEVGDRLLVKDTGDENRPPSVLLIDSIDTTNRFIGVDMRSNIQCYLSSDMVLVKIASYATSSNWAGFMQAVVDESPKANIGVTPWITANDVAVSNWAPLWETYPFNDYWRNRSYRFVKPVKVKDVLVPEFQATGWMGRLALDGKIDVSPMPLVSPQRTADHTLTDAEILLPASGLGGEWPTWQAQLDGLVNIVYLKLGYSPYTDDFNAQFDRVIRRTDSISEHKSGDKAKKEVAPYSMPSTGSGTLKERLEALPEAKELAGMVSGYLQTLAQDYAIVTVSVPFTKFNVLCGDIVSVTSAYIPDGTGSRGVSGKKAICVGRDWNLDPAQNAMGSLTLYFPRDGGRTAGYAPTGRVTGQTNTTGDIWVLEFEPSDLYNTAWSEDDDGDVVKHFEVGDVVEVLEVDASAESRVTGVITDKPSSTQIEVTFDASWSPIGPYWNLRFANGPGVTTSHELEYCWVADDTGVLLDGSAARGFV